MDTRSRLWVKAGTERLERIKYENGERRGTHRARKREKREWWQILYLVPGGRLSSHWKCVIETVWGIFKFNACVCTTFKAQTLEGGGLRKAIRLKEIDKEKRDIKRGIEREMLQVCVVMQADRTKEREGESAGTVRWKIRWQQELNLEESKDLPEGDKNKI